mmetsp:Transcript_3297/g.8538  ORF Transcript_3297/g.8538 Transcript_3297/m.8538 type:complete len:693 (-) Transcript_3297:208-2286(-)
MLASALSSHRRHVRDEAHAAKKEELPDTSYQLCPPQSPSANMHATTDTDHYLLPPTAPKGMLSSVLIKKAVSAMPQVGSFPANASVAEARTDFPRLARQTSGMKREENTPTPPMIHTLSSTEFEENRSADQETPVVSAVTLPPDEFIDNFRKNASICLRNAYMAERQVQCSSTGAVSSSLAEDISFIISAQLDVLHDYLVSSHLLCSNAGDVVITDAARTIVNNLWRKQIEFRDSLLDGDAELCCASSNDFFRLMDISEEIILDKLRERYPHMKEEENVLTVEVALPTRELADLTALYGSDAVYAAQMIHALVIEVFQDAIVSDGCPSFFSRVWEEYHTNNEVATSLVRTMEDCLADAEMFLGNPFLYKKAIDAMVAAAVAFYIRMLLQRAADVRQARREWKGFSSSKREDEPTAFTHTVQALRRIEGDIETLRSFFDSLAHQVPGNMLKHFIAHKFTALTAIHECLCIAVESPGVPDSLLEFVVVLHKLTGCRFDFTKLFVCDLWHLVTPALNQTIVLSAIKSMEDDLNKLNINISVRDDQLSHELSECERIPGLRLDLVLAEFYGDDVRRKVQKSKSSSNLSFKPSTIGAKKALTSARQIMAKKLNQSLASKRESSRDHPGSWSTSHDPKQSDNIFDPAREVKQNLLVTKATRHHFTCDQKPDKINTVDHLQEGREIADTSSIRHCFAEF